MPDSGLARLAAAKVSIEIAAGKTFIDEGEPAAAFFVVAAGTTKLLKTLSDGRRQIVGFAGPGQFLGLAALDTYAFSAEALDPMRVCRFPRSAFRALLDAFPLMEKRLLYIDAASALMTAQAQMVLLGRKTARERLASFLLVQSRQGMPTGHARRQLRLPMTRTDMADYLGLTIETVSRTLTRLCVEKTIALGLHHEVAILDLTELEMLAGGMLRYDTSALMPANSNVALTTNVS